MRALKLIFSRMKCCYSKGFGGLILFVGLLYSSQVQAFDITVAGGSYSPEDSAIRDMYDTSMGGTFQINIQYYKSFDWITRYSRLKLKSKVKGLESEATFNILNLGIEKRLVGQDGKHAIEPFFGFGISGIQIKSKTEDEETDSGSKTETDSSVGTFWELGVLGEIFSSTMLEFKMTEQYVKEKVFSSSVALSGQIITLGLRVRF